MKSKTLVFRILILLCFEMTAFSIPVLESESALISDEKEGEKFLEWYNDQASETMYKYMLAQWEYYTNITAHNKDIAIKAEVERSSFAKSAAQNASMFDWSKFTSSTMKRRFRKITDIGPDALNDTEKLKKLSETMADMKKIHSEAKVCNISGDKCLDMEFGITPLMAKSRDYVHLLKAWKGWRDATGKKIKPKYVEYVRLINEGVKASGDYSDNGAFWRSWYETPTFQDEVKTLLKQLHPLYSNLHAYVRSKLQKQYSNHTFPKSGHIPAHILGNVWSQFWRNIYDIVVPYPKKATIDVSNTLKSKNYTAKRMYETAEKFFISLGLPPLPTEFWNNSLLSKPADNRSLICYASAWDMGNTKDYRIKMCTDVNMYDLIVVHHELGHIMYDILYKDQPYSFRQGANPGFHEAIGDLMALSVMTPKHLHSIGLLDSVPDDHESDINFLMSQALDKIAFLPFGYLIDQWRWSVFSGDIKPDNYTKAWWDLRCKYQGIHAPVERNKDDFDPAAKYHIPSNTPYIRYFVSYVIQFQFHKSLCAKSGHTGPLYKCDIHHSTEAGKLLRSALQLGSSKPWPEAMKALTGQSKMDVGPLMEYFNPLIEWLKKENEKNGVKVGWAPHGCPSLRSSGKVGDEEAARRWLQDYEELAQNEMYRDSVVQWEYNTNITEYNQERVVNSSVISAEFSKEMADIANLYDWQLFEDEDLRRQFKKITDIGTSVQEDSDKIAQMNQAQSEMESIYSTANVCLSDGSCNQIEPGLTRLLATSENYTLLTEAWKMWREETGKKMKSKYRELVDLSNEAIRLANYSDIGEYWRSWYETPTFQEDLEKLLKQLEPLYKNLHAFVRQKLRNVYGEENFPISGHIPAHLLGNMWAQQWNNINKHVAPFPDKEGIDVTPKLKQLGYNATKLFRISEEFFLSLGLLGMPDSFWRDSMITKPSDREVVCHASAWDFYNRKDFRIKMCTDIVMEDLITIHHEMGHIQYFLQYKDQPLPYREGANPGFHEAVGDVMALSVSTPEHLHAIGLLDNVDNDTDSDLNFLMSMALEKIAFLPFGYLIDQWRWSVFSGDTPYEKYNDKWWELRCKHQGLSPPVERFSDDFDPGAKYHVPANVPYIRYFVSFVIQFQFHQALCKEAGQTNVPLHRCDIYNSKEAGKKLSEMLKLGSSVSWQDAMEKITGQRNMRAEPLLEYFKPLTDWLIEQNKGETLGWSEGCPNIEGTKAWLSLYNNLAQKAYYKETEMEWAYATNITDENAKKQVDARLKLAQFEKDSARNATMLLKQSIISPSSMEYRELKSISAIGTSAIKNETKLKKLNTLQSDIEGIYGKGEICFDGEDCLPLEPDIYRIMSTSRNYTELEMVWKGWRDVTGKKMKEKYAEFVQLSNDGIKDLDLGFKDTGDYWRSSYESATFQSDLQDLLQELKPLYQELHTYVRKKLKDFYGAERFPESGHIPAHILGNMWAQEWQNLYNMVIPFKGKANVDITPKMKSENFTALKMFKIAEDFFVSLGLKKMPQPFWDKSIIEKPAEREIICHGSAWDFYNQKDFRIKMCTDITMEDLITIHHEMGHIQYYLQYMDQPVVFRDGANPGFHEAIGDTMALSASTPKHLHKIGLLDKVENDRETDLNFLMKTALEKIAFLPFGYLMDQWRWSVFSGETTSDEYNQKWWQLRCKYQGISPPVMRTEEDFDPGAKYHIPSNTPYIRYFVSFVIQFQFHKALCEAAGQTGPLYQCDIYQSKEAGRKLGEMLKLGSSVSWQDAMEKITGQRNMSAEPLLEYFKPLMDWLVEQNEGENQGWSEGCPDIGGTKAWLSLYNTLAQKAYYEEMEIEWAYASNITDENAKKQVDARLKLAQFQKDSARNATMFMKQSTISPSSIEYRELKSISMIGTSAIKNETKLKKLNTLQSDIEGIYGKGEVCFDGENCLPLEPDIYRIMSTSRNYTELQMVWKGWRDVTGKKMKEKYAEFVQLSNDGIKDLDLGFKDTGDYWRSSYESDTFQSDLQDLLQELKPLYQELHTYVRRKLKDFYGAEKFPDSGHIPAHVFGNMWAQEWQNLYDMVIPFKGKANVDITPKMKSENYTALKMFKTAEDFFVSLGLKKMPKPFWDKSIIEKPAGREIICHASAWDFYNQKDFRIKMCTDITMENLITIHHEMGHIQYYLQYMDQPLVFREGANPGFHEAIGDTMALSASTPKHLHKIGLLDKVENDTETDLNFLMKTALEKIAFLPFGYLIDQWRWSVFSGDTTPDNYNQKWWELRCKYQGISPPVIRTDDDFDPGAKYHIPSNTPYIRYFVSFVIQFQFHKALCEAAGQTGPLYQCDIYQSKEAGRKLGNMLQLGSSLPWQDAMETLTGERKMSVKPLLEYFKPLSDWLKEQNRGQPSGWNEKLCPNIKQNLDIPEQWLRTYNKNAQKELYEEAEVEWTYATNITDENSEKQVKARLKLAKFQKESARKATSVLKTASILPNSSTSRQLQMISKIGTSALKNETVLEKLNKLQSSIEGIYGKGEFCLANKTCLSLEPDMYRIMSRSRNFTELEIIWKGWRDVTGKRMKNKYSEFVDLSNEGIKELGLGFSDTGDYWRSSYESSSFQQDLKDLLTKLKPLYQDLHTYVRKQLRKLYGTENFPVSGHIPAHILGNMWAQEWQNLYDLVIPYKDKANVDITPEMKEQNFTALQMFKTAEEFFTSLGLKPMPETFWNKSLIEKPVGRDVICHASAWDFYNQKDFRIKMCTDTTMEDLITVHHEMGHIQYFLQYKDQPVTYRDGANPGFHEAIGDTMALSVSTPKHLHRIGLLKHLKNDKETDLNFLMKMALEKIAFLPFGYLIDQWRWSVFSGKTPPAKYNKKWWELRCFYQGISPPVPRSDADFDPGAKYHIPSNTPYIRYFVSFVIQFQFHKALCEAAGHRGPLYQCDIYQSKEAGKKLADMLRLGSSRPWPDAMETLTGQRKMDVSAILEYFEPLQVWLKKQNEDEKQQGWEQNCQQVKFGQMFNKWLDKYEGNAEKEYNSWMKGIWNYETNVTDENRQKQTKSSLEYAHFQKDEYKYVSEIDTDDIKSPYHRRLFTKIANIGTNALSDEKALTKLFKVCFNFGFEHHWGDITCRNAHLVHQNWFTWHSNKNYVVFLKNLNDIQSQMIGIYSKAKVKVNGQSYELEPGLSKILAESTNYNDLLQAWQGFREAVGPQMKPLYTEFIYLNNKALAELGYENTAVYERGVFELPSFLSDLDDILSTVKPLYESLHAYTRRELIKVYGVDKFPSSGHIPAHLLGNMWAQKWDNIYRFVQPFKNKPAIDVTPELIRQNYTTKRLFKTAEEFFISLGMDPMTEEFWQNSMMEKPEERDVLCHAGAYDFYDKKDFRIKMCTVISHESLMVIHHEMGHIQYFMHYKDQPVPFREGANPGFHEAVGDTIALSVQTPQHLQKIGLLRSSAQDTETDINFLMRMALEKIAFFPFAFLMDHWRWSVFSRETIPDDFNRKWWEMRCKYQGVSPPVERSENDFDPGAKYHIPANYMYISYFLSYVMQFQFQKALCDAAGYKGPLHKCDIYQSKDAGKLLSEMLQLGSSVPWPDAMEKITGQRKVDAGPLMEYFKPLSEWLENEIRDERPGWTASCPDKNTPTQSPKSNCHTSDATSISYSLTFLISLFVIYYSTKYL